MESLSFIQTYHDGACKTEFTELNIALQNVDIKKAVVKHVLAQALFDPNENVKLWREKTTQL